MTNLKDSIKKCKPCKASSSNISYYTDFNNFPSVGEPNTLYVDTSTGATYIWNGTSYITDNQAVSSPEERLCLNTGAPFLVADPNNPSIEEVEAWAILNLTIQQRENGTQLVYFVDGDGGSCDNPDYVWTLNKGSQVITLSNKRVFNTKTVYVDAGSGSDVTGRRGYREFPFKTLDAAIAVTQTGDLLKVFPGDYTQTTPITRWININCENGVDWLLQSNFSQATDFALAKTVSWKFDVLRQVTHEQYTCRPLNTLGGYNIVANKIENILLFASTKYRSVKVNNSVNSSLGVNSLGAINSQGTSEIDNAEWDYTKGAIRPLFLSENNDNAQLNFYCRNLTAINSVTGSLRPVIGYYFGSDIGINKHITTEIDNVYFTDPNIYVTPPGPLADVLSWRGTTGGTHAGLLVSTGQAHRTGSIINLDINNIKSTGHGVRIGSNSAGDNIVVNVKIKGVFEKGVPIYTHGLGSITNSKIIIELDVECHTSMGLFIGFSTVGLDNNIGASNQIIVTGRIKTRYAGMSCISIGTGSAVSNNTNGTILLKDLTLINDGTVSPIMCAVPENIQIQNVTSNSLISDPNILEIGQSIIRTTNYK